MDRREFFRRVSALLAVGALTIGGQELAAKELIPLSPDSNRLFTIGTFQTAGSDFITLMDPDGLQYVNVHVTSATKFTNHPSRHAAKIDGLIEGELLFATGELRDGQFFADVIGTPYEPFRTVVQAINGEIWQTEAGELIVSESTRPVDGEGLQAVPIDDIQIGNIIEGNSIYDIATGKRYVSMVGRLV